ncbi:MAG: formyltransferase family protein [Dehalococcoidia bacterium]
MKWLVARGTPLVSAVVHPDSTARYKDEITEASGLPRDRVFLANELTNASVIEQLRKLRPEVGISAFFAYILKPEVIDLMPMGCINVHPGYLPFNKGRYPNVWAIVDRTPAGVTLHYIDKGVDTGDIVAQQPVPVFPTDTGEFLYRRLETASIELVKRTWPCIEAGTAPRHPQVLGAGTFHRAVDVTGIDRIDLDRKYDAGKLIDILRARSFPPYRGAYFEVEGQRIYLRLELFKETDAER